MAVSTQEWVLSCQVQAEVQEKYMPTAKAEFHYWVSNAYLTPPLLVKYESLFILASEPYCTSDLDPQECKDRFLYEEDSLY